MPEHESPDFDMADVYDHKIAPLVDIIADICELNGIPMLACFCYRIENGAMRLATTRQSRDGRLTPSGESFVPERFDVAASILEATGFG